MPRSLRGLIALCVLCVVCGNPVGSAFSAQPGSLDTGFDPGTGVDQSVFAITVQSDGRIVIAGDFNTVNGAPHKGVARLWTNGVVDPNFSAGDGPDDVVNAVALQGSKLIIGGYFASVDNNAQPYIARLGTSGALDATFDTGTGPDGPVLALAVQPDGKVLLAGTFNTVDGVARTNIARLLSNGAVDMDFDPGDGVSAELFATVNSIALQADGKVVIGGAFSKYDGTPRNNLARLNTNGVLDAQFTPFIGLAGAGVLAGVNALAIQGDGRILIGGDFTSAGGSARTNVARLNSNGGVDLNFDPVSGPDSPVTSLAVQENGKVVIGGFFSHVNGTAQSYIARLNTNGLPDTGFITGAGTSDAVYVTALQADGQVLIGGTFTSFNNIPRHGIARLQGDAVAGPPLLFNPNRSGTTFAVSVMTVSGKNYFLEFKDSFSESWTPLPSVPGNNATQVLTDPSSSGPHRFYRVRVQ